MNFYEFTLPESCIEQKTILFFQTCLLEKYEYGMYAYALLFEIPINYLINIFISLTTIYWFILHFRNHWNETNYKPFGNFTHNSLSWTEVVQPFTFFNTNMRELYYNFSIKNVLPLFWYNKKMYFVSNHYS